MSNAHSIVTVEAAIPRDWFDRYLNHMDAFSSVYCGGWLRNVERRVDRKKHTTDNPYVLARLVYDCGAEDRLPTPAEEDKAIRLFNQNKKLPKNFYVLDRKVLARGLKALVEQKGVPTLRNYTATDVDYVFQVGLLGKPTYG